MSLEVDVLFLHYFNFLIKFLCINVKEMSINLNLDINKIIIYLFIDS
jgi:hypothetical protein